MLDGAITNVLRVCRVKTSRCIDGLKPGSGKSRRQGRLPYFVETAHPDDFITWFRRTQAMDTKPDLALSDQVQPVGLVIVRRCDVKPGIGSWFDAFEDMETEIGAGDGSGNPFCSLFYDATVGRDDAQA